MDELNNIDEIINAAVQFALKRGKFVMPFEKLDVANIAAGRIRAALRRGKKKNDGFSYKISASNPRRIAGQFCVVLTNVNQAFDKSFTDALANALAPIVASLAKEEVDDDQA